MKKIFAIVMVVTVLGSMFVAGCGKKEEEGTTPAATAGTTADAKTDTK